MKDTKSKAHELAAIVESVAGILFDTPEPERKRRSNFYPGADEDGMVGPEPEPVRKTGRWIQIEGDIDNPRYIYCSACNEQVYTNPFINRWRFCPYCGAEMISEAG